LIRADWPVTDTLTIPGTAVSGYYYALLRVTSGGDDAGARGYVAFAVREAPSRRSQILVQVPVNTWQAYNAWGGKSLYPHGARVTHTYDTAGNLSVSVAQADAAGGTSTASRKVSVAAH
jgi:hypothetical protein